VVYAVVDLCLLHGVNILERKEEANVPVKGLVGATLLRVAVDSDVVPVDPRWPRVDLRVVAGADGFAGGSAGSGCCRRRELDIMTWKGVCC
jgi:hypothetical protein